MLFGFKKEDLFCYAMLLSIIGLSVKMYSESDAYNLKCIISDVDGNTYCVRDQENLDKAADLLANVTKKCKTLVLFMKEKYPEREDVARLVKGFKPEKICETLPTSKLTAYSENKGQKIVVCLRDKKNAPTYPLIDKNTVMFVMLHEMAHLMTETIGHTQEFWSNFKRLLGDAVHLSLYTPVNYAQKPTPYCGMTITDTPI